MTSGLPLWANVCSPLTSGSARGRAAVNQSSTSQGRKKVAPYQSASGRGRAPAGLLQGSVLGCSANCRQKWALYLHFASEGLLQWSGRAVSLAAFLFLPRQAGESTTTDFILACDTADLCAQADFCTRPVQTRSASHSAQWHQCMFLCLKALRVSLEPRCPGLKRAAAALELTAQMTRTDGLFRLLLPVVFRMPSEDQCLWWWEWPMWWPPMIEGPLGGVRQLQVKSRNGNMVGC